MENLEFQEFDKFAQNHGILQKCIKSWKILLAGKYNFNRPNASDQHTLSSNDILSVCMRLNSASWKMSSQAGEIMEKSWNFIFKSVWSPCW